MISKLDVIDYLRTTIVYNFKKNILYFADVLLQLRSGLLLTYYHIANIYVLKANQTYFRSFHMKGIYLVAIICTKFTYHFLYVMFAGGIFDFTKSDQRSSSSSYNCPVNRLHLFYATGVGDTKKGTKFSLSSNMCK